MGEGISSWATGTNRLFYINYASFGTNSAGKNRDINEIFRSNSMSVGLILGLKAGPFWLLIGLPIIVIALMFLYTIRIRAEKDD